MSANVWTGMCAAIVSAATVGAFAQAPQQTTTPQTPTAAPAQAAPSSSDKRVTVTGCLKAAPAATVDVTSATPTGTAGSTTSTATGTAGTTDPAGKFVLTGASTAPSDSTADSVATQTYRLIANPTALTAHVGKKLELVGTIDTTSVADPKDPSASAPALRVESGKIVAASCSE